MLRQPYETPVPGGGAEPFRVSLPESLLADLHERLERTPGAHALAGRDPGLRDEPLLRERELATYWKDEYDWRAQEARLNAFGQYTVPLKGINLHPIHERADGNDAVPILLLHGWPSSVWELHEIFRLLTGVGERGG